MKKTDDNTFVLPDASSRLPGAGCTDAASSGSLSFKDRSCNTNINISGNSKNASIAKRRILGIDPGLASTGWGIIDVCGSHLVHIAHGVIETSSQTPHQIRLLDIYNHILAVLREYAPSEASMEALYFAKNVTSGLVVAEARGVVTLCLAQNAVPLAEYSPLSIKQSVVGSAKAEKKHVQQYVKLLLGLQQVPKPDHAADALAAAITHTMSAPAGMMPL